MGTGTALIRRGIVITSSDGAENTEAQESQEQVLSLHWCSFQCCSLRLLRWYRRAAKIMPEPGRTSEYEKPDTHEAYRVVARGEKRCGAA